MRLNTRMRYGTRALLELALRHEHGPVSLGAIAAAQELPDKYLEALFVSLRVAGLVTSQRGAQGGYTLARAPEQITLKQVFDVLESPEPYVACTGDRDACHRWADCVTQQVWADMYSASMGILEATTLADLVRRSTARATDAISYAI
jgi:Rrf2 family protein